MRSVITATLMSLALLSSGLAAQKADFSGRWISISPGYTGQEVRITRTRTTLKVTQTLNRRTESVTYNLDGTPRREPAAAPAEEHWSVAAWLNAALVLTDTRLTETTELRTTQTLSLDSAGRLILGITRTRRDLRRQPSTPSEPPQSKTVIVLKKR